MYTVIVPRETYQLWECYEKWSWAPGPIWFQEWVMINYPEIKGIREVGNPNLYDDRLARAFVFESEEHYHWFLLKQ